MKKKILLVEHTSSTIDIIKEIFPPPLFEITVAHAGDIAKELLGEKSFDLMITAAMLPKFHGFNLSQYAAENYPDLKIIITSDIYKGMDYKYQATTLYKANDFFEKPFDKKVFKDRVFELLDINEEDLKKQAELSASQVPFFDTKKIPTMKKMEEEGKKLSSEDLFGDIIEQVHDLPSYEIKLDADKNKTKESGKPMSPVGSEIKKVPPVTQEFAPPVKQVRDSKVTVPSSPTPPVTQVIRTPIGYKTQKIDLDILDLIQTEKKVEKEKVGEKEIRYKKIEDDISRKLEDTLSGLGISSKPASSPAEKAKTPKTEEFIPPKTQEIKDKEKSKPAEMEGYEILGLIGRGGMAEIYKAKKKGVKGFEKIIALKKILSGYGTDAKYIEMFVDEAKIAAELSHPNIVQIYDLGKSDDYYFIAMEYVSGKDLRVILQKVSWEGIIMPEPIAIYLVMNVLAALNYAHAARDARGKNLDIVHRDISPPNILVSYEGNIKLTDFGVSKASIKMHQTLAGALKGKLLYMSPEQAKGEDYIDFRSDLYSVGIILFELITGKKLFLGSSEINTLKKVQEGNIIKPSQIKNDIDPELETIILKALNKEMNRRYQKAADMIKDLEAYMKGHYNNMPEASHVAHFIINLFKDEIKEENLDISLPQLPYTITKIRKKEEKEKEEIKREVVPTFKKEAPPDEPLESEAEKSRETEIERNLLKEEEFQPIIEINFDEDKQKEETPVEKVRKPVPPSILPEFTAFAQDSETRKKKSLLVAAIIVILVLVLAIILYVIFVPGGSGPEPQSPPASATMTTGDHSLTESSPQADETSNLTDQSVDDPSKLQTEQLPADTGSGSDSNSQTQDRRKESEAKENKPTKQEEPNELSELTQISTSPKKPGKEKIAGETEGTETPDTQEKKNIQKTTTPETGELKSLEEQAPQHEEKKAEAESITPSLSEKTEAESVTETPKEEVKQPPVTIPEMQTPDTEQKEIVKEGDILSPSQVDTQPIPISTPPIKITHSIRRLMTSDQKILVSFLIDHNGSIEIVKVLSKSSLEKLNTLISETIQTWKYKPATKNNIKVKVWKNKWIAIKK